MPPKKEPVENDNTLFLLACMVNLEEAPKWTEIATMMGIAGSESLPAGKAAQRKFKKIVDTSDKFELKAGKVVLKGAPASDDNTVAAGATPTTATPAKKRKSPTKSPTKSSKKVKATKDEEAAEGDGNDEDTE